MKKKISMDVINPHCAGIDVGSRSHFVAIGQQLSDVREFGVYAEDLRSLCLWLRKNNITSVAMESTGNYWQNLFSELVSYDIEVVLANGKHTKNAKGKKTDVKDARWIQQLHTLGLLSSSFLPDSQTEVLRTYCRHRTKMIEQKADTSHKMQKYLKLLNFRLDVVVRDITGQTGIKIINDICNGILDPKTLAQNRHYNCRKSEEEICKALHSNERTDYIFGLKQEYERYLFYLNKIAECDKAITQLLETNIVESSEVNLEDLEAKPHKRVNKNTIKGMNLNQVAFQYFNGIDLFAIPGVSHSTILTLMSELGKEGYKKFNTAKQFTSWLRLAPNNKISGGKTLSRRVPRGSNRIKIALRNAANAIGRMKDNDLSNFFAKMAFKKGRQSAITATARKLATIIWNMLKKHQQYNPKSEYLFLDQKRKQIAILRKKISKFGIDPNELGIFTKPEYRLAYEKRSTDNQ
jgi:transposase